MKDENILSNTYPSLVDEWCVDLNLPLTPSMVTIGSKKKVFWKCQNGHIYQSSIRSRATGHNCPICSNTIIVAGFNDLQTLDPILVKEWDYEKNTILPSEISYGSNKNVWWVCSKGHHFLNSPKRIIAGERCPYCSGRRIQSDINSLLAVNPNLAKEWDVDKNTISSDSVAPNSTKKYWWKCSHCGYSWQATCANRHSKKSGCPQCYKKSRSK